MIEVILSVNGIPIRLNSERWFHIILGHPEVADYIDDIRQTIESPSVIYAGSRGELLAVRELGSNSDKNMIVVYKEVNPEDGFIITAYLSNKIHQLQKRTIVWQRQN